MVIRSKLKMKNTAQKIISLIKILENFHTLELTN